MADASAGERLLAAAREAKANAYHPYSSFPVGAAVRLADGTVLTGVNVENASYGLTCCAERVALFRAVARGARPGDVLSLAVSCGPRDVALSLNEAVPCGACRQVMAEFMAPDAAVILELGDAGETRTLRLDELLPTPFKLP